MLNYPFLLYVFAVTSTPGPGNLAHMAVGQTLGLRKALPFWAGTATGLVFTNIALAFGLGELLMASETAFTVIRVCGTAYILYLAWKVVRMNINPPDASERSFAFRDGLLIHPLNPKGWAVSVVGFAQFSNPDLPLTPQFLAFAATYTVSLVFFHGLWCVAGASLVRLLRSDRVRVAVNCTVALVMVGATLRALMG
ncbi:LysE family translocator [Salidesulfovibrio onnuriiensis]|uniref:LysE family translocator n=1 Tax=Salidesulfovibrio onnuriiensis TaxID=2583823 RepID=UPI0011CA63DB|nr:LysE family translocator [Salidesulfovibrio onnuriiensis]